jgi:signal peptidase
LAVETLKRLWKNEYFQTAITIALLLLVVLGFYYGTQAALGTEYPALAVASGSMLPTLNIGDLIIVQKIDPSQINASKYYGDILVFRNPSKPSDLIVHRAVKIEPAGNYYKITTAGDAYGGTPDGFSPWNSTLLIGKVVARIPYIGNLPLFLHSERNMYVLFLLILIILIILMLPLGSRKEETQLKEEQPNREGRFALKVDLNLVFYIVLNVILVGFIVFSLWGSFTFWQPGATPPQATIRGMYADLQFHERYVSKAYLSQGLLTYTIDSGVSGGTRLGVPTFSWYQFFLLVLVMFNAWKIYKTFRAWRAKKGAETIEGASIQL